MRVPFVAMAGLSGIAMSGCVDESRSLPDADASAKATWEPRVYLHVGSHNEVNEVPWQAAPARINYLAARNRLRDVADAIVNNGGKFNWQTDYPFLQAAATFDPGDLGSGADLTIVEYLVSIGVEVNPHHHEGTLWGNYADVAALFPAVGVAVDDLATVGAFNYCPGSACTPLWVDYESIVADNSAVVWAPDLLWGATPAGLSGTNLVASGMWLPDGPDTFTTHDSSAPNLPFLPGGCEMHLTPDLVQSEVESYVDAVIQELLDSSSTTAPELWTQRIMINQRDFDSGTETAMTTMIGELVDHVNATTYVGGFVEWATPSETLYDWAHFPFSHGDYSHVEADGDFQCPAHPEPP